MIILCGESNFIWHRMIRIGNLVVAPEGQGGPTCVDRVSLRCSRDCPPSAWGRTSHGRRGRSCRGEPAAAATPPSTKMSCCYGSTVKSSPCRRRHLSGAPQRWDSRRCLEQAGFALSSQPPPIHAWNILSDQPPLTQARNRTELVSLLTWLWLDPAPPQQAEN